MGKRSFENQVILLSSAEIEPGPAVNYEYTECNYFGNGLLFGRFQTCPM